MPAGARRSASRPTAKPEFSTSVRGVGKLCVAASLLTGASFVGIEQRPHLVHVARGLASELRASSATFICADAFALDWRQFTGLYLYNPFAEALFPDSLRIDRTVPFAEDRHAASISHLLKSLAP